MPDEDTIQSACANRIDIITGATMLDVDGVTNLSSGVGLTIYASGLMFIVNRTSDDIPAVRVRGHHILEIDNVISEAGYEPPDTPSPQELPGPST